MVPRIVRHATAASAAWIAHYSMPVATLGLGNLLVWVLTPVRSSAERGTHGAQTPGYKQRGEMSFSCKRLYYVFQD